MERINEMANDPKILLYELKRRRRDIIFWASILFIILLIFIFISSKNFSFFLVLSSLSQTFAFIIILVKVSSYHSTSGLSSNTLICYAILLFSRLTSTLFYSGYLPSDTSGTWLYQLAEILSLLICILLI